jgi:hypothetical protein
MKPFHCSPWELLLLFSSEFGLLAKIIGKAANRTPASMANNAGISVEFEPSFNLRQADESFGTL